MLELQRNLFVLRRWWWLLLAGALIGGSAAYGAAKVLGQNSYDAAAVVSIGGAAQGEQGDYIADTSAAPGGQLITNSGVLAGLSRLVPGISPAALANDVHVTASETACVSLTPSVRPNQCRLLFLHAQWSDPATAIRLANAAATIYVQQEAVRLKQEYALYHRAVLAQERALERQVASRNGSGPAYTWAQAQVSTTIANLAGRDANMRVQSAVAETSLQIAAHSTMAVKVSGPKLSVDGVLGALVGLFLAWVIAFLATPSYGDNESVAGPRSVLTRLGE